MALVKIELENFKSYKGIHSIGPFDKFSCIIGPNGSGKSNILDAISFGLNVPNSCLRVKHLKNLIEQGESSASVRIWIDSRKFERKVLRQDHGNSGDASILLDDQMNQDVTNTTTCKYRIDDVKVTQKQYNIELEKLNIFSKIKNFAIYQGDIIKTEVDLLNIVETACGSNQFIEEYNLLSDKITVMNKDLSVKYEKRKDILEMMKEMNEVKTKEKNFENFILQKEEAQRALYELEIRKKGNELSAIKNSLNQLEKIKQNDQYDESMKTVNKLRGEAAKLQKEYFEKETELTFMKSKANTKIDFDLEGKTKELEETATKLSRINEELMRLPEKITFNAFYQGEALNQEKFENLFNEKNVEYSQKTSQLDKEISEITLKNFDKISKRDQIKGIVKQNNTKKQRISLRNKEIIKENTVKEEKIKQIGQEIKRLETQIEEKVNQYERIITDEENLNKEFNSVMKEILLNKAKKTDLTKKSLIKSVVENLKTIFSGVHGRVIDLIQPTQKKYELAIGVLLSKYDQAVIVENDKTAMDCLRYIKESSRCKLTFLPLTRIKNLKEEITGYSDKLAKNCIVYDPSIEIAINFIFKNSLILDSNENAKNVIYNEKYKGSVCTLAGTLFTNNGLITGGVSTINKFEDSLIDGLITKRKTILNDLKIIKDRREAFSDVEIVKNKINELNSKVKTIHFENIEEEDLIDLNPYENELKELENSLKEFEETDKKIRELKKQIEKTVFGDLLNTIGIKSLNEYRERMKGEIKRSELMANSEYTRERLANLRDEIKINTNNIEMNQETDNKKEMAKLEKDLNKVYTALEEVKERLKSSNQNMKGLSEKREELSKSILNHQLAKSKVEEDLKDLVKYAELEVNYTVNSTEIDTENLLNGGYKENLETSGYKEISVSEKDILLLKHKIDELSRLINENVPTVTANDSSVQSKYAKATREYEIAKEALVNTKKKLQVVKSNRMETFGKCFEMVSSEITEIYRQLTLGDVYEQGTESNAYLVYEGDPFANNIKFYLMPPSKRFIPFHELSGGERSIAFLSFMFALSKFKKAPFYIFDEVDSALDKMNVEKLANYFTSSGEQCLVVSLKPQLFSKSESLFGVYKCPVSNSSKVLSLKLN